MREKDKQKLLLVILILILIAINYPFLDKSLEKFLAEKDVVLVERVIDGDTIVSGNNSIRLLGINSPERGELYYDEAKGFLEGLVLNKTVNLKFGKDKYDKYGRILAYVFLDGENINLRLVEEGLANYYFYGGKDRYSNELVSSWDECINNNENLCEKSINSCSSCINIDSSRNFIVNTCSFSCDITDWWIKGEGRKTFIFSDEILESGEEILFELELMDTGDTIFLRDGVGRLVLWESY